MEKKDETAPGSAVDHSRVVLPVTILTRNLRFMNPLYIEMCFKEQKLYEREVASKLTQMSSVQCTPYKEKINWLLTQHIIHKCMHNSDNAASNVLFDVPAMEEIRNNLWSLVNNIVQIYGRARLCEAIANVKPSAERETLSHGSLPTGQKCFENLDSMG